MCRGGHASRLVMTPVVPARKVMVAFGEEDSRPSNRRGGAFHARASFTAKAINLEPEEFHGPALPLPADQGSSRLIVVGVGASAGGLEAFTELLGHLPDDTGLAFVLIQHLDPSHESHLTELLSKASKMPVSEVKGETRAQANHVYVIPPRSNLSISGGVLHTAARPDRGRNLPIDSFLRALAADQGNTAIGVVLSGSASDGTLGLEAIKAAGGVTFAQETETAKFDSMPKSAIAAGVVDFILPPSGIARQLAAIARTSQVRVEHGGAVEAAGAAELAPILRFVRSATGMDFTHYKHTTLARRIKRRMALRGFETLEDYSRELEQNREEAIALCEDCFVTVTSFFREPAVFEELKKRVFPALVENRGPDDPIRIWVPGCATGEEAYSIAICLMEFLDQSESELPFRDFRYRYQRKGDRKGSRRHIQGFRLAHVSPQRLARFFTRAEHRYQVAKIIRDVCVFARHNVAQDPPFSKAGPHQLLQRADLPRSRITAQGAVDPELRPQARGLPGAGSIGKHRHAFGIIPSGGEDPQDLLPAPAASAPAPRLSEGRRAEDRVDRRQGIAEDQRGWTCKKKPTG